MCVSLYGALAITEKTNRPHPPSVFSKATAAEAERAICGNLCRCTGYRSLSDACKSFGSDVDLEDLGLNSFWKKGESDDIEGAFVQGLGFFMLEEYETNHEGLVLADGTWKYKIPTLDTVPKQLNVEIVNSGHHKHRVLSLKASGEPPLLLASSVHCAIRAAIKEARKQLHSWSNSDELDKPFQLDVPATMAVVKEFCGLDIVERYLSWKMGKM
ncbi:indole-3-acetaldehyde oxidase-like [Neltuma alba]|uniref:indole-3-acetaldehyde oxidase-like n=1 Tax=Neltuma alba TaxID=207710 RepID=UPI0010A3500B|nr:indole-3-acetaldehyde oxidase-like [Prosopis alba]